MPKKTCHSSCELPERTVKKKANLNRHYRFRKDFSWKGVTVQKYKHDGNDWSAIARQVLIGASGESAGFHLRYFEIEPGGYSSFETHKHEHVVVGIRGKGRARLEKRNVSINYLDILYIKPDAPHRLYNPYNEPFGFFCIVNAKRDRPRPVKK